MATHRYGKGFFDYVDATSGRSAEAFLARVDLGFAPRSVLDVGCGRGIWLAAWKVRGVAEVLGLDGGWVDPATLKVPEAQFRETDLSRPFELARRFDLVQCLEVAEHLPAAASAGLVASLAAHGDVILFSAAPPGQGGEHHVNEQPLQYWADRFAAAGFVAYDCVRPVIRGAQEIEPWYRYNTLVFANDAGAARLSAAARATRATGGVGVSGYEPLAWRVRRAVIGVLPRGVVDWLAGVQHRLRG